MKPNLTLPEIHERFKKQSLSQRWQPTNSEQVTSRKSQKKEEQYRLIEVKLEAHKQELQRNAATMKQLTDNFQVMRSEMLEEQRINEELKEAVKSYREEIDRLNKQLRSSKNRCDDLEKQLTREQQTTAMANSKMKELESRNSAEESKRISKLEADVTSLTKMVASLKESNTKLNGQLDDAVKHSDATVASLTKKHEEDRLKLTQQLEATKRQLAETEHTLLVLEGKDSRESKHAAELQSRLGKLNESLRAKEDQLAHKSSELKGLQDDKRQHDLDLHSLRRDLDDLRQKNVELEAKGSQYLAKQQELEHKIRQLQLTNANLKTQVTKVTQDLTNSKDQLKRYVPSHLKLLQLSKQMGRLEKSQKQLQSSVTCTYCNNQLKEPVTIIPCGHCFCLNCKKGYQKDCCRCGPKVKIDALYRNELLDEVLEVLQVVESLAGLLTGIKETN